jgi:hypothetical protein
MDWLRVALGLIREAAGTEAGREVIDNVRSAIRKDASPAAPPPPSIDIETLIAEHRAQVDRNLEVVVQALNAQNQKLEHAVRRQRIWDIALAAGILILFVLVLWLFFR